MGDTKLVLHPAARPKLHSGDHLGGGLRAEKLHFFSPLSGERIAF
jgi:hypothetical protein